MQKCKKAKKRKDTAVQVLCATIDIQIYLNDTPLLLTQPSPQHRLLAAGSRHTPPPQTSFRPPTHNPVPSPFPLPHCPSVVSGCETFPDCKQTNKKKERTLQTTRQIMVTPPPAPRNACCATARYVGNEYQQREKKGINDKNAGEACGREREAEAEEAWSKTQKK